MFQKKSQITLFIIAGIMVIIAASIIFFAAYNIDAPNTKQLLSAETTESGSIRSFVQDCVDNAAEQSIILLGLQGGHVYLPDKIIPLQDFSIAYDYYEGQNLLPTKDQIEQDMSKYVSESVVKCVDESKSKLSSDLELGEIKTVAKIAEKEVIFDVNYPIAIKSLETTEKIDRFKTNVPVRLNYMLNITNLIIGSSLVNKKVNVGLMTNFDINKEVIFYDDYSTIYIFSDSSSEIDDRNYTFMFANKFKPNSPPDMLAFGAKRVQAGKEIIVEAKAIDLDGDEIIYSGIDNRIMDEKTGVIKFMSSIAGTYAFQIRATDAHGDYDEEELVIKVIA